MRKSLLVLFSLQFLLYTACSGGGGSTANDSPENATAIRLSAFASDSELEVYLKSGLRTSAADRSYPYALELDMGSVALAQSDQGGSVPGKTYSTTNLQEPGVDEADRVKSDGSYLYIAPAPQPLYYTDFIRFAETSEQISASQGLEAVRVMALEEDPAQARAVAAISTSDFQNPVTGLYLVKDRALDAPDLLVTIGSMQKDIWGMWSCAWCWQNTSTEVGLFDVSVPEDPQAAGSVSVDGQLIGSRRIGEYLYLVTRYTPFIANYNPYPATTTDQEQNEAILTGATLTDLLPAIHITGRSPALLVAPERTYLPPLLQDRPEEPTLITVTAIDLRDPGHYISETIAGPAETVYVSSESLVIATTRYRYSNLIGALHAASAELNESAPESTEIHKFQLTASGPVYAGSGSVTGNLGWEANKRPFRFGENQGVLRVATSLGETWNETSTTRLSLVMEQGDGLLKETAHLDNIGENGERLYAVRYTGKRAYLVTFRMTDPLYVFDLSDPFAPYMAGELHIDGYSDYLHPIDDTRLLGIGKDAVADESATDFSGRGAWYQGVKLTLFDVTDPAQPEEINSVTLGRRGTESDALIDHHAVTFLPAATGVPARLALPIRLHDTPYTYNGYNPDSPSTSFDWTHTGLYMFDVTREAIQPAGQLIVDDRSSGEVAPFRFSSYGQDRSVMVNDNVHYIHRNSVWSAAWGAPDTLTGAQ